MLGLAGTAVHFAVLTLGVLVGLLGPVAASCLGALAGALINYALTYRFTFRSRAPHPQTLSRFLLVAAAGFVLNGALMQWFTVTLGQHFLIAQTLTTALMLSWYFAANNFWTFRQNQPIRS